MRSENEMYNLILILYVQDMTNYVVRPQLIRMLNWKAGILTRWTVSTGKSSKYLYMRTAHLFC